MASCSFDKYGIISIVFGKQHQHTFRNDVRIQLSLSLHVYLFYLHLITAMERMWNNVFSSIYCWWLWKEPVVIWSFS